MDKRVYLKKKSTENFMKNWTQIIYLLHERENDELMSYGSEY